MLERFYPNEYLDSVYDIDFEMYYKQGIRGIISDIDNTHWFLTEHLPQKK